jgi:hypothetical protein
LQPWPGTQTVPLAQQTDVPAPVAQTCEVGQHVFRPSAMAREAAISSSQVVGVSPAGWRQTSPDPQHANESGPTGQIRATGQQTNSLLATAHSCPEKQQNVSQTWRGGQQ